MKAKFGDKVEALVEKGALGEGKLGITSAWEWEHWRGGKLIDEWKERNLCTNEGLDAVLNIMFHASTQITVWAVALFEDDYTPISTNTYATPGYTESSAYTEGVRQDFVEAAAASQSITNSASKAEFSINATKTIYGAALVGGGTDYNTKGNTAGGGTLFSSSKFSSSKAVENGDTLKVTITITSSDM
ncbi:MAG: hypothetical protein U9R15_18275 [Chloroflexota bacterium]|nr:hypothetical protein [Chloroflexota bacterium]